MAQDAAFQKRIQRMGELVEQLELGADPSARAIAKELLESLMSLHGSAIERILEIVSESAESGAAIIRECGNDELVGSVLLLHGLHPEPLETRIARALENSRAFLESHTASAELISIREDGTVRVRLEMKSSGGCGSAGALVKSTLEAALQNAAPDAPSVVVEEVGGLLRQPGFVSVTQLASGKSMKAGYALPAERSGD